MQVDKWYQFPGWFVLKVLCWQSVKNTPRETTALQTTVALSLSMPSPCEFMRQSLYNHLLWFSLFASCMHGTIEIEDVDEMIPLHHPFAARCMVFQSIRRLHYQTIAWHCSLHYVTLDASTEAHKRIYWLEIVPVVCPTHVRMHAYCTCTKQCTLIG